MITMHNINALDMNRLILYGLKTDAKPLGVWVDTSVKPPITRIVGNGSVFVEIDNKKRYLYDEANAKWEESPSGGGDVPEEDMATEDEVIDVVDNLPW